MIRWKQKKHTEPHEQRGKEEDMNEQEARKLISALTLEEKIKLYELLSDLPHKPAPAPVQSA